MREEVVTGPGRGWAWRPAGSWRQYEAALGAAVIALVAAVSLATGGSFWLRANLTSVLVNTAMDAVPAIGMTMVIILGGIDVSIGSVVGLVATVLGLAYNAGWGLLPSVGAALAVGTLAGLFNGVAVVHGRIPPIIVTLGMMSVWRTVVFLLLGGNWITNIPYALTGSLVLTQVAGVPVSFLGAVALALLGAWFMRVRPLGRYMYGIGNNEEACRVAGVPVGRVKLFAYSLLGLLTAAAALVTLGQSPLVQASTGSGFELTVIAAVVVGGTSITGGRGSVLGSLLGALLVEVVQDAVILLHIQPFWEGVALGTMILLAVAAGSLTQSEVAA